jgi:hypothetical protein
MDDSLIAVMTRKSVGTYGFDVNRTKRTAKLFYEKNPGWDNSSTRILFMSFF